MRVSLLHADRGVNLRHYLLLSMALSDRADKINWKLCNPASLELRGKQVELIILSTKSMVCLARELGTQVAWVKTIEKEP